MTGFVRAIFLLSVFFLPLVHWRALHDQTELPKRAMAALLTWILAAFWAWSRRREAGDAAERLPALFWWALAFFVWELAIWPFAIEPSQATDFIFVTAESLTFLWLAWAILDTPASRRIALLVVVSSGFMASCFGLMQYEEKFPEAKPGGLMKLGNAAGEFLDRTFGLGNPFATLSQTDAPGSFFGHTNLAAEFVSMGLVIALALALTAFWRSIREKSWKSFFVAFLGFGFAGFLAFFVLRTGSRAAALACGVAVLGLFAHIFLHDLIHRPLWGSRVRHLVFYLTTIAVLGGVGYGAAQKIMTSPRSGQEQVTLWERITSSMDFTNTTIDERFDLWGNTLAMSRSNPVFGVGPGNFAVAYPRFANTVRVHEVGRLNLRRQPGKPHNEVLNLLAENGAVGLGLAAFAFLAFLVPFLKRRNAVRQAVDQEDGLALASIAAIAVFLVVSVFGFPWQQSGTRLAFLTVLAIGLRLGTSTVKPKGPPGPVGWSWAIVFGFVLIISAAHFRASYQASLSTARMNDTSNASVAITQLEALRAADQTIRRVPARADYQLLRAHLYRRVGLIKEAEEGYLAALDRAPHLANAWLGLARVTSLDARPNAAKRAVRRALELQPNEPRICVAAGEIYENLGERNAAIAAMLKGLELAPIGPDRLLALLALTRMHSSLGNLTTAALFLSNAEQLAPGHLSVLESRAYFYERHQPKSKAAMDAWAKFSAASPYHAEAHLRLSENLLQRSDYNRALAESEAAYLADENLLIALYRRAQAQVGLDQLSAARGTLAECMRKAQRPDLMDPSLVQRCLTLMNQIQDRAIREGLMPKKGD